MTCEEGHHGQLFTVANKDSDRFLPKVNINEGDQVQFLEDGKLLFSGPVFDIEKSGSGMW